MHAARVCILLTSLSAITVSVKSTPIDEFLSLANGNFDNYQQIQDGSQNTAHIQITIIPADVPAFRPTRMWYDESWLNGMLLTREMAFITEGPENTIFVTLNNFTDPNVYKDQNFNIFDHLSNIRPENLTGDNCTAVYRKMASGVYAGIYSDCSHFINGIHPFYAETIDCDSVDFFPPPTQPEIYSLIPYVHRRKSRYPMPGFKDTFDQICGGKH